MEQRITFLLNPLIDLLGSYMKDSEKAGFFLEAKKFTIPEPELPPEAPLPAKLERLPFPRGSDSAVSLTDSEVSSLLERFGSIRLGYWVTLMNDYALTFPAKFKKYKNHRAVIDQWDRKQTEAGKEFAPDHPSGAGFYPAWVVRDLRAQLSLPSGQGPGNFPK